ncbi:TIGR03619 family F420-dependent LLM class oxidoreductase [Cryptosporangium sp. NPDC048952]|uniref:TIGR03619 family F420-dependent LLM class oxidoreductase n=1 Tax=Cryptosporangium sp. NPDC048952 TaxID=3363961 RepID=UPI0037163A12
MRFGVSYSTAGNGMNPDRLLRFAQHAEACGFESFYVPEHLVLYPGAQVYGNELPADLEFADPLDLLTFVAAATHRIVLGTAVLLLPYRHPIVLAKRLATIDALSRGRMRLLTIGLGSLPGEAEAMGVDFATRGRRADESIDALRQLWGGDAEFNGVVVRSYPKPFNGDVLPIHVAGSSAPAARRAGKRGDGYFPGGALTPTDRAAQWELVRSTAAANGRDPDALEYTRWGSINAGPSQVEVLAAEGVTRLVVNAFGDTLDEQLDQLSAFASRHKLAT